MRFGTFLLGGLVGAAAVVYMSRGNKSFAAMTNLSEAGKTAFNAMNKAKSMMNNQSGRSGKSQTSHKRHNAEGQASAMKNAESDLYMSEVERIVSRDPELKSAVNDILADNPGRRADQISV